jgi:hypothetical protein
MSKNAGDNTISFLPCNKSSVVDLNININLLNSGDLIKEDEMGGAFSTRGRDEKCIQYFGWKT